MRLLFYGIAPFAVAMFSGLVCIFIIKSDNKKTVPLLFLLERDTIFTDASNSMHFVGC